MKELGKSVQVCIKPIAINIKRLVAAALTADQ